MEKEIIKGCDNCGHHNQNGRKCDTNVPMCYKGNQWIPIVEESKEKSHEFSYRMVMLCSIGMVVLVMVCTLLQTDGYRKENRVIKTENDSLRIRCNYYQERSDSISNFRHYYSEHNQSEITKRINLDKSKRLKIR